MNNTTDWQTDRDEMREAIEADRCHITPDGWCATHSGGVYGAVYCEGVKR